MSRDKRIVVDTTCLISSYTHPDGLTAKAVERARENYTIVLSPDTFAEVTAVLSRDDFSRFPRDDRNTFLEILYKTSLVQEDIYKGVRVCEDPADDMFISTALSTGARQIITGDKDLRAVKHFHEVEIWSPRQFLELELEREKAKDLSPSIWPDYSQGIELTRKKPSGEDA